MADTRKLGLQDISDLRAYERERSELQHHVFEAKRLRRVALGSIMSLVFENALTVRYQIQEMAHVEKLTTDAQILGELKVYNPLIPDPGELSATLFIELTDEASLREWLPKLVGNREGVAVPLRRTGVGVGAVGAGAVDPRGGACRAADSRGRHRGCPLCEIQLGPGPGRGVRVRTCLARERSSGIPGRGRVAA